MKSKVSDKKIRIGVVKTARKLFANTPVEGWRITGWTYQKVFQYGLKSPLVTVEYFGARIAIPARSTAIAAGLVGGFYEKRELEIYQALCSKSRTIVDVGGNVGLYACIGGLSMSSNRGQVVCFEPIADNLKLLEKNVKLNKLSQIIKVVPKAVGASRGKLKIYLARDNIGSHSAAESVAKSSNFEEVEMVNLDDYLKNYERLDILKVDVEGYEGQVLKGAKKILKRLSPSLFIELRPLNLQKSKQSPEEFVNILAQTYSNIFLVDDKKHKSRLIKKPELLECARKGVSANLIAVNNKEHLKIIHSLA
jgi:FkbM family methyltransferase